MNPVYVILKREFLAKIRTRSFWIISFLGPIFLMVLAIVPIGLSLKQQKNIIIEFQNNDARLTKALKELPLEKSKKYQIILSETDNALAYHLLGKADALVVVPDSLALKPNNPLVIYSRKNLDSFTLKTITDDFSLAIYKYADSTAPFFKENMKADNQKLVLLEEPNNGNDILFSAALLFSVLVYLFILNHGVSVIRSIQEEKTSRLFEVILVSTKGWQLMLGKVLGIFTAGVLQSLIWVLASLGLMTFVYKKFQLSRFDSKHIEETLSYIQDKDQAMEMNYLVTAMEMIFVHQGSIYVFAVFTVFGYLLYSTFFSYFGSMPNQHDDLQKMVMLISIPLVVSILSLQFVFEYPQHWLTQFFTYLPLTSPIVLVFRHTVMHVGRFELFMGFSGVLAASFLGMYFVGKAYQNSLLRRTED